MWSNLKVAAEAMLNVDYDLANTVLDAADIRVPNGDLSICYDALGQVRPVRACVCAHSEARADFITCPPRTNSRFLAPNPRIRA